MHHEEEFFRAHVPVELLRAITRAVVDGCTTAYDEARKRDAEFIADAIPQYRRLTVEPMLSKIMLPSGFSSKVIPTPSTNYTQISSDRVVIAAVTRTRNVKRVSPYRSRQTLARPAQMLFEELLGLKAIEPEDDLQKLFALVIYGGSHRSRIPTLAGVAFPLSDGKLLPCRINLLSEYSDIVDTYRSDTVHVTKTPLKIRKQKGHG